MALLQYPTLYTIIFTAVVITIPVLCGVQVIPERVKVVYVNEKYMYNYTSFVKRYNSRSVHYITVDTALKYEWNNNVTMHLVFNEFHHNEYRRSFIELHQKYCDLVKLEKYVGVRISEFGYTCPLVAEKRYFLNFTMPVDEYPNVFPYEHGRFDIEYTVTATSESIVKVNFYAHFKNTLQKH